MPGGGGSCTLRNKTQLEKRKSDLDPDCGICNLRTDMTRTRKVNMKLVETISHVSRWSSVLWFCRLVPLPVEMVVVVMFLSSSLSLSLFSSSSLSWHC